jgi:hypothetical protein
VLDSAFLANKMNWVNAAKCRRGEGVLVDSAAGLADSGFIDRPCMAHAQFDFAGFESC